MEKTFDWPFRKISIKNASSNEEYKGMLLNELSMNVDTAKYMNYINDRFELMFPSFTKKKGIFLYLTSLTSPSAGGAAYNIPLNNKHCIIFKNNLYHLQSYAHEIAHTLGLEHFFLDNNKSLFEEIESAKLKKSNKEREKSDWFKKYAKNYIGNSDLKNKHEKIFDKDIKIYDQKLIILKTNKFRFEKNKTENLMDYNLKLQKSLDKWQWEIIQNETKTYYHE